MKTSEIGNFAGYVSQKNWKDSDTLVECTVECAIDGVKHKTVFDAVCPMTAIEKVRDSFDSYHWVKVEEA